MAGSNGRPRRRSGGRTGRFIFLVVVGLVTVSLSFLMGVLVGQKWARGRPLQASSEPAKKAPPRRALSAAEAVKPPQIQEKLTFYQTLTAPLAAMPPPPKPEAKARENAPRERTRAEGAGTQPPPETSRPAEAEREGTAATPERAWTVQVVAYRARPAAEEMEKKLKEAGFDAYVASITGHEGRTTHRVRVGNFLTRAEAEQMAERLRGERGLSTFVTAR